jgi:molecular chaperone HtpG
MWKSNAAGNFIITKSNLNKRGTRVTLFLKPDALDYTDNEKISSIVTKHVGFLKYSIRLYSLQDTQTEEEYQELNKAKPIWTKNKSEITRSEYEQLFKNIQNYSSSSHEYITSCHFNVEGSHVFTGVLFIPRHAPSNLFTNSKERKNIRLHVKNIFITDDFTDYLPEYLGFIVGIIDAENLPLNVSRESLQQNESLKKILRQNIVRKTLEMLENLSFDSEKYDTFLSQYDKCIKYAAHEEKNYNENVCKRFIDLLRFKTSFSDQLTSLSDYVSRMKENQYGIFLMTGENLNSIKETSRVESVTGAGYEVLFLDDPIDVFFVDKIHDYNNIKIYCISREGFKLTNTI